MPCFTTHWSQNKTFKKPNRMCCTNEALNDQKNWVQLKRNRVRIINHCQSYNGKESELFQLLQVVENDFQTVEETLKSVDETHPICSCVCKYNGL